MKTRTMNLRRRGEPRIGRTRPMLFERLETRTVLSGTSAALLVQLKDASFAEVSAAAGRVGATLMPTLEPGVMQAIGSTKALDRLAGRLSTTPGLGYVEPLRTFTVDATQPDDPSYANGSLWGLNGAKGIDAPTAWDAGQGSSKVVVGVVDTGIDYDHPDLYMNVWINQAEIPASRRANLTDVDGDGLITFYDLNYKAPNGSKPNQGPGKIADSNGDGRISGSDLLVSMYLTSGGADSGQGGWSNGVSDDRDGYVDDIIGWNFVDNTNKPYDDHGHGTHVSGIIGATGDNAVGVAGVNWTVQIMALKFLNSSGSGYDSSAAAAVRYAADHGARLTNNSYGGVGEVSSILASAISSAASAQSVFVAAAGNSGLNIDVTAYSPSSSASPNVVSVAAIDSNGSLAGFSNFGSKNVDLAAPGVNILSTLPGNRYGYMSGTSMAAPFVSGSAALLLAAHPTWGYSQVVGQLLSKVKVLSGLQGKVATGGTLNVGAAIGPTTPTTLPAAASFKGTDATTRGTWQGTYGAAGAALAAVGSPTAPGFALKSGQTTIWNSATTDVRGLQRPGASTRIAATWVGSSPIVVDLDLSAGPRAVSLYFVDWYSNSRSQKVEVLDAVTGAVLDSRSIASFHGGVYLTWNLQGRVSFRVTRLGADNAVLSGLFVDASQGTTQQPITTPADGSFKGTDATTRGTWQGTYGAAGAALAAVASPTAPGFALKSGQTTIWNSATTDVRGLQRPGASTRIAATWVGSSPIVVDLDLSAGPRDVSLYFVDWYSSNRSQQVDLLDADTGAVLDSRPIASFQNGVYLTWTVQGRVSFRVTRLGSSNAILSGLFVD
ncbi:S8 family serine peptidase [Planctomyces sp. SH-PL62]|uniref:S8 family serine peptidase n=1 Tax=Planctomyces sp. SH-PL62 TaxID=1636152 RepID=UPI00078BE84C|nr:S8 family serine peptidase [Planctomyces sp. SH-PL62]AMV40320.1 Thermophilic serine proteinase precursor [Planctomyces sp. SH-PL62]